MDACFLRLFILWVLLRPLLREASARRESMKSLEIHSQEEYEANQDFDGILVIKCQGIVLRGNASAVLRGNAHAVLRGNASAVLWGNASAVLWGNAHAVLRGNASAVLRDNASAVLRGNASAELRDNASAVLRDNASAIALDNAFALLFDKAKAKKLMNATVKKYKEPVYDAKIFSAVAEHQGKMLILYKSVDPETLCDFRTGKIKYAIGTDVECPDWDPDPERECGGGLHLSHTAMKTQEFSKGKILKCLVDPNDIVVYRGSIEKVRCRKVRPIAVVDIHGREVEA